jgi:hypothetical protein
MGLNLSVYALKNLVFWRLFTNPKSSYFLSLAVITGSGHSTTLFLGSYPKSGQEGIMSDTFDVLNPATEDIVKTVHMASADEIDAVVAKAQSAWPAWDCWPLRRGSRPCHHSCRLCRNPYLCLIFINAG